MERELCLLVQIETQEGLDNLEAIAAVDGVDGVFIGPEDLSASLGYLGQFFHPNGVAAIDNAIDRLKAVGKLAEILTLDPAFAKHAIEQGTLFTAVGMDVALLARATENLVQNFKK